MLVQVSQQPLQLGNLVGTYDALVDEELDVHVERNLLNGHIDELWLGFRLRNGLNNVFVERMGVAVTLAEGELHAHQGVEVPVAVVVAANLRVEVVRQHVGVHLCTNGNLVGNVVVNAQSGSYHGVPAGVLPQLLEIDAEALVSLYGVVVVKRESHATSNEGIQACLSFRVKAPEEVGQVELCFHSRLNEVPAVLGFGVGITVAGPQAAQAAPDSDKFVKLVTQ